jgi:hypothetical protein
LQFQSLPRPRVCRPVAALELAYDQLRHHLKKHVLNARR